jgi:phage terminase large subunit-like protein
MPEANFSNVSLASSLAQLPQLERDRILKSLTEAESQALVHEWRFWGRPGQFTPGGDNWFIWLILAGRGFGKTRSIVECVQEEVAAKRAGRIGIAGATSADVRDILIEGESGFLAKSPPWNRPVYEPSKRRLTWPSTGARATLFSADEPDRFRGPQHDFFVADELAAWRYPEAWDQAMLGLRLGRRPRAVVATTPRPTDIIRSLLSREGTDVVVTRGRTRDNQANLAPTFLAQIVRKYEGTRLGRQELDGEVLDDAPGALWKRGRIEQLRVAPKDAPEFRRVVVAVDPAVSVNEDSDETGIICVGLGHDKHAYVIEDGSLSMATPNQWAQQVVAIYKRHKADRVVAEVNNGGDLVEANLRTAASNIPVSKVHASRGKAIRAEPIAALYEQGKVHHIGCFPKLEDQMVSWDPALASKSPDRMDALVWALSALMLGRTASYAMLQ